jgi:hypothetical protein
MKRNLIALIALTGFATSALAFQPLPGDLGTDFAGWRNAPEATSYVPAKPAQPVYEFVL